MAEVVQWHIEQMLPELEQMQRVGLFTQQEIKCIIQKRKDLEYRVRRRVKRKEDFLKYIQYEVALLKLLQKRRKRIGYHHKKNEIDGALRLRIKRFFQTVVYRYQSDVQLWLDYIAFLKELNWKSMVSRAFVRMLAVHSDKPDVWIAAANYEFQKEDMSAARALMLRALRFHPTSHQLFLEYFRLELMYAEAIRQRAELLGQQGGEDVSGAAKDAVMEGRLAAAVYESALTDNPVPELFAGFLSIAKEFDFTEDLRQLIVSSLKEKFASSEVTWDTLARLELEDNEEESFKKKIKRCFQVYEEGLEMLNHSERLWELYLDTVWSLYKGKESRHRRANFCKLCARAAEKQALSKSRYHQWINLLVEDFQLHEASRASILSLQAYPKEGSLWKASIELLLTPGNQLHTHEEVISKFKESVTHVKEGPEKLKLWKDLLQWLTKNDCLSEVIKRLLDEATEVEERSLVQELRAVYLHWTYETLGLKAAWKLFEYFCDRPPLSLPLHTAMLTLLDAQDINKINKTRRVFNSAVGHFGRTSVTVWLSWMEWEEKKGDPSSVSSLHQRAVSSLEPHLVDQLVMQSTLRRLTSTES